MNQLVKQNGALDPAIISSLVIGGDLKGLNNEQRLAYYKYRCQQVGLDPSAKPFDLLTLNGKQVLYANAGCTQQLCQIHGLSPTITGRDLVNGIYCVTSRVTGGGRTTENMGAVPVDGLKADALANAMMKAVTKAHRRTVLMHCGLGMLDETEVETIPNAQPQGRGNPLRQEFAALSYELDACKSREQIDLLFGSPEFEDFERRDSQQSSGMSFAGMMRDKAEQMKKKLPERVEDKRNFVKTIDEYPNGGASSPDVTPAGDTVRESGSNFPPQESAHEGETVTAADRMEMDYLASVDSCDTQDELKRVRGEIEKDKDALGEQRYAILKRACVARKKEIEKSETLAA